MLLLCLLLLLKAVLLPSYVLKLFFFINVIMLYPLPLGVRGSDDD